MNIRFVYLGFVAPSTIAEKGQNSSVSGNNAEINFICEVLARITDQENIDIVSYQYNLYHKSVFGDIAKESFELNEHGISIKRCYPLRAVTGKLFSKVRVIIESFIILNRLIKYKRATDECKTILITVNTYPAFALPAIMISKIYKVKLATYLIDGYYSIDSKNIILRMNAKWAIRLLKQYDYIVSLCQNILDDYGNDRQNMISITPIKVNDYFETKFCLTNRIKLLFAGGLAPLNGIREYIEALSYLDSKYVLDIYGVGELVEYVKEKGSIDSRVCYHGIENNENIRKHETEAHILLIVRSDEVEISSQIRRYGIPYKVLEYLQSGTPIIASEIEAIPQELSRFTNICDPNGKSIAYMIMEISNNYEEYKHKALCAREYMKENCTWDKYKVKICDKFDW